MIVGLEAGPQCFFFFFFLNHDVIRHYNALDLYHTSSCT